MDETHALHQPRAGRHLEEGTEAAAPSRNRKGEDGLVRVDQRLYVIVAVQPDRLRKLDRRADELQVVRCTRRLRVYCSIRTFLIEILACPQSTSGVLIIVEW